MLSLRERIDLLESDLRAIPPRISVYRDLPFGILRYEPDKEWDLRRELRLLEARLEGADKHVRFVSMADLLWEAIDETEGMDAIVQLENQRGFHEDHIGRYSKSRRKAPIYWLLQSTKRAYGLWIYYHRLDADMLFKALTNYVDPKVQREEGRLADLRSQKVQAGSTSSAARQAERAIDSQETLIAELRDFRDKLYRAASLDLKPDLDDGVVLNAAPLWELMPWKVAKDYWQELLKGEYAWSSIGKQLRAKKLVAVQ